MSRPNVLVLMADQVNGTLFADGPADFGWTPDYRRAGERIDWWYHNLGSVTGAGVAEISNQMEYAAEGTYAPLVSIREGAWKYNHCEIDPPQLFNLDDDPDEMHNLALDPTYDGILAEFNHKVMARWDIARFDAEVRESQARRLVVYEALRNGAYYPWDYQPLQVASERYMRNHMDLNVLEEAQRFPRGE
jgi:choline-sulfatase